MQTLNKRNSRKTLIGTVVSTKNLLTATVSVETKTKHPLYHKPVLSHKKYHAHNDGQSPAVIGDRVQIVETRPLSKTKRWRISKIIEKAK